MMKRITIILAVVALLATSCGAKKGEKQVFEGSAATAVLDKDQWTITDANGNELVTDYDSMRVVELGEDGHPATVIYFKQGRQTCLQFYSNMALRGRGDIVDGQREGMWQYYFANGTLQAEATFVAGLEDGPYRVYRENGVPYYIGQYKNGARVGTWEVYDPAGNLVEKMEMQNED